MVLRWLGYTVLEDEVAKEQEGEAEDEEIPSAPGHHRMLQLAQGGGF